MPQPILVKMLPAGRILRRRRRLKFLVTATTVALLSWITAAWWLS